MSTRAGRYVTQLAGFRAFVPKPLPPNSVATLCKPPPLEATQLGPPPVPKPAKIVAAGRNYAAHTEEAKMIWQERGRTPKPPTYPTGFFKMPSAVIGPYDGRPGNQ